MIALKAVPADCGAKGFDSYAPVNDTILDQAWADGCRFVVRYLHNITEAEIECIISHNFAFMLVTYANNWDGADAVKCARAVGYPAGATLWLDIEGVTLTKPAEIFAANKWSGNVRANMYDPGHYIGAGQYMNSMELTQLSCDRYWEANSLVVGSDLQPARPLTGWNMTQTGVNLHKYGTVIDHDFIRADGRGRLPTWAVAA